MTKENKRECHPMRYEMAYTKASDKPNLNPPTPTSPRHSSTHHHTNLLKNKNTYVPSFN